MTDTRTITLGGQPFAVPPLPLGVTRIVYPLCRKLSLTGGLIERVIGKGLLEGIEGDDLADLATIAQACAQAADPAMTAGAFEALPVTPPELWDTLMQARYLTGMWSPRDAGAGEATGEASPPSSTSTGSSPA